MHSGTQSSPQMLFATHPPRIGLVPQVYTHKTCGMLIVIAAEIVAQAEQAGFAIDEVVADHGTSGVSTRQADRKEGRRLFDMLR